jgi:hypothetical protein
MEEGRQRCEGPWGYDIQGNRFVSHEKRWVDISLRNSTGDWLRRSEEQLAGVNEVFCCAVLFVP